MTATLTRTYLSATRSVLDEAKRLQELLAEDPAAAEFAAGDLADAADRQDAGGDTYLGFMFSQREAAVGAAAEESMEELLAGAVAELQVANVLMAAGQATGEGGTTGEPRLLEQAVAELEGTVDEFDRAGASSVRLGFSSSVPPAPVAPATDEAALQGFLHGAETTLTAVVTGSSEVVSSMVSKLAELAPDKVVDALGRLGKEVDKLPKIGRVLRLGLRKLEKVLNLLSKLVGRDLAAGLKDWLQQLWDRVRSGELVPSVLERTFDLPGARAHIAAAAAGSATADRDRLAIATQDLEALQAKFQGALKIVRTLAEAAGLAILVATGIALFVPQLAAVLAPISALVYLLITAAVVLLGMDYLDARLDLRRVDGVRSIADRLSA